MQVVVWLILINLTKIKKVKKLLLILICLFVSFEVKSDDLSGKQLLCSRDIEKDLFIIKGYQFLNNSEIKIIIQAEVE